MHILSKHCTFYNSNEFVYQLCKLLHMKTAHNTIKNNDGGLTGYSELVNELIGIYVKNGRIKVAPNEHCDYEIDQETCYYIKYNLEEYCENALQSCVGKTIYDD